MPFSDRARIGVGHEDGAADPEIELDRRMPQWADLEHVVPDELDLPHSGTAGEDVAV